MKFDINSYETVASRIDRLLTEWPDARIVTEDLTTAEDRQTLVWRVKAYVYLTAGDQAAGLPKATGHAFEIDGQKGANLTSAYENCETSSIGRAVSHALTGYSGDKKASREEMQKVERGVTPQKMNPSGRNWATEASKLETVDDLRSLWIEAKTAKAPQSTLDLIQELADAKSDTNGEREGAAGGSGAGAENG
jgi:hypothetical protein